MGGAPDGRGPGPGAFLRETLASLGDRRLLVPAALLTLLLTATNIVILHNMPVRDAIPPAFLAAALVRIAGLLCFAVAILRILGGSARPPWRPDGAFWLYALTLVAGFVLKVALARLLGGDDPVTGLVIGAAVLLISAPFAAWFAAIAVERPLALAPGRWLRGMAGWLPALLLWSFLTVLPLGQLHAAIGLFLVEGGGELFWPLALADGPLSAVLAIFGLALAATAYRRVARG
jgi:hypothetical protein